MAIAKDPNDAPDRNASDPPAVAGATRPRFGEVTIIHDHGHVPHWENDEIWVGGQVARPTASGSPALRKTGSTK